MRRGRSRDCLKTTCRGCVRGSLQTDSMQDGHLIRATVDLINWLTEETPGRVQLLLRICWLICQKNTRSDTSCPAGVTRVHSSSYDIPGRHLIRYILFCWYVNWLTWWTFGQVHPVLQIALNKHPLVAIVSEAGLVSSRQARVGRWVLPVFWHTSYTHCQENWNTVVSRGQSKICYLRLFMSFNVWNSTFSCWIS